MGFLCVQKRGVKVARVKWEDVWKPKSVGDLGVRDLRIVNFTMLNKWR